VRDENAFGLAFSDTQEVTYADLLVLSTSENSVTSQVGQL